MEKGNANNKKLENALDYSVKLLNSGASIEDCLKLYPNQRRELRGLLEAAVSVKEAYPGYPELRPSKLYTKTGREKFLAAIEGGVPTPLHRTPGEESAPGRLFVFREAYRRVLIPVAAAAAALLITTGGLVYASGNSLPGSPLYGIKRAAEGVQLALAFDPEAKAKLHYEFAQRRVAEAKQIAKAGSPRETARITEEAKESLAQANKVAKVVPPIEQGKIERELERLNDTARGHLAKETAPQPSDETTVTGKSKPDTKVALRGDEAPASGSHASATATTRRKRGVSKENAGNNKSLASMAPFEVGSVSVSGTYISPDGNGANDALTVSISGATQEDFKVALFKGSRQVAVIAEQPAGSSLEFTWDGRDTDGSTVADGEYAVKVVNNVGQVAHEKARVIIDTTAPAVTLVEPPAGIETTVLNPRFVWRAGEDAEFYSLKLTMDGAEKVISGLTESFYLMERSLLPGTWTWRVTAVDKAGNKAMSEARSLTIVREATKDQQTTLSDNNNVGK